MAKTKKPTAKKKTPEKKATPETKLKLEWGRDTENTQRLNIRCSANFKKVLGALRVEPGIDIPGRYWGSKSEADVIRYAVAQLGIKHKLIKPEDLRNV